MTSTSPFGMPPFDPSKMDPKVLIQLSQIIQELPADKLSRMQTLMHNMMAGFDVRREMEEFEKSLPPGFRERLMSVMGSQMASETRHDLHDVKEAEILPLEASKETQTDMNLHEARLTILRAVASGSMTPEDAEKLLFAT